MPFDNKVAASNFDLADHLSETCRKIQRFRMRNKSRISADEVQRLENIENELNQEVAKLRAKGVSDLGKLASDTRAEIEGATHLAHEFLDKIDDTKKAMSMCAALLGLGAAVGSGNFKDIPSCVKEIKAAKAA